MSYKALRYIKTDAKKQSKLNAIDNYYEQSVHANSFYKALNPHCTYCGYKDSIMIAAPGSDLLFCSTRCHEEYSS